LAKVIKERRKGRRPPPVRERSPGDLDVVKLISHELRGPTTVLRGHLSMWLEGSVPFPDDLMPALRTCYGSVLQLNNLINQMILAMRIRDDALVPSWRLVDFTAWLRGVAHDISIVVASTGHGFQLELPRTRVMGRADVFLLATALFNLVDNAQKFSPRNSIIRVACRRSGDVVEIDVIDKGTGFPPGFKLEPFARVDGELGFERPGVGVGLFIAEGVARAHGGSLDFNSSGSGSLVRIALPNTREAASKP
jgi:signal transduction histidine kinase